MRKSTLQRLILAVSCGVFVATGQVFAAPQFPSDISQLPKGQTLSLSNPNDVAAQVVDATPLNRAPSPRPSLNASQTNDVTQPVAMDDWRDRLNELLPEERVAVELYATRNKSVVNVSTVETRSSLMFQETAEGCGSGIVINKQGVVLTNFHVVENASKIDVTLFNGETYPAKPIGLDPNTDVALVKIDAPADALFPIEFGDSSRLLVGQTVYAIGNPFGLERTMTKGIVSNLNRSIGSPQQFRQIKGVIQVDAAINPGNSGGVLLDTKGRMIGMNTAIASRVGENSGVGFAVPANTIHRIVTILLEKGEVVRGDAGVVQVTETEQGLVPVLIDDGGAADEAGLRGGKLTIIISKRNGYQFQSREVRRPEGGYDLIVGVNGEEVKSGEDFITAVEEHAPGETITLNVNRNGKALELPIVLK